MREPNNTAKYEGLSNAGIKKRTSAGKGEPKGSHEHLGGPGS